MYRFTLYTVLGRCYRPGTV